MMAWRWADAEGNKRLVVVNFSDAEGWAHVPLADATAHGGDTLMVTELLAGTVFSRSAEEVRVGGLVVGVGPYSAQIFEY